MKQRMITALGIALTIGLFFVLKTLVSDYFFDVLILGMAIFAGFEASKLLTRIGLYNNNLISAIFPACLFLANILSIYYGLALWIAILIDLGVTILSVIILFSFNIICFKGSRNEIRARNLKIGVAKYSFRKAVGNLICFVYPSLFLMIMMFLNHFDNLNLLKEINFNGVLSIVILLLMFLIPIFTDTFAMLCGTLFGGKKLCPKISPNKKISGAIGGTIFCTLLTTCLYFILNSTKLFYDAFALGGLTFWMVIIIAFIGSIIAQIGDLFESYLKRKANVKDSGKILPGHGGMLDRIDSYVFVAPYLLIVFWLIVLI